MTILYAEARPTTRRRASASEAERVTISLERAQPSPLFDESDLEWDRHRRRLFDIRRLKDDWDDGGARAPDPLLVDAAIQLLDDLRRRSGWSPPERVLPTPDGTVVIEWRVGAMHLTIEILSPEIIELYRKEPGRPPQLTVDRPRRAGMLLSDYFNS